MPFTFPDGTQIPTAAELESDPRYAEFSDEDKAITQSNWLKKVNELGRSNYADWKPQVAVQAGKEMFGIGKPLGIVGTVWKGAKETILNPVQAAKDVIAPIANIPEEYSKAADRAGEMLAATNVARLAREEAEIAKGGANRRPGALRRGNQREGAGPTIGDVVTNSPAAAQFAALAESQQETGPLYQQGRYWESPVGNLASVAGTSLLDLYGKSTPNPEGISPAEYEQSSALTAIPRKMLDYAPTIALPVVGLPRSIAAVVETELASTYTQKIEAKAAELGMPTEALMMAISQGSPDALRIHDEALSSAKKRAMTIGAASVAGGAAVGKVGARIAGGKAGAAAAESVGGRLTGENLKQSALQLLSAGGAQTERDIARQVAGDIARAGVRSTARQRAGAYAGKVMGEMGAEGVTEGAGEALGQLAAGDPFDIGEIALEVGGGGPAVAASVSQDVARSMARTPAAIRFENRLRRAGGADASPLTEQQPTVEPDAPREPEPVAPAPISVGTPEELGALRDAANAAGLRVSFSERSTPSLATEEGNVQVMVAEIATEDGTPQYYFVDGPKATVDAFLAESAKPAAPVEPAAPAIKRGYPYPDLDRDIAAFIESDDAINKSLDAGDDRETAIRKRNEAWERTQKDWDLANGAAAPAASDTTASDSLFRQMGELQDQREAEARMAQEAPVAAAPAPVAPVAPEPAPAVAPPVNRRPSNRKAKVAPPKPSPAKQTVDTNSDEVIGTNDQGEKIYWSDTAKTHYTVSNGRVRTAPWIGGLSEAGIDRLHQLTEPAPVTPAAPTPFRLDMTEPAAEAETVDIVKGLPQAPRETSPASEQPQAVSEKDMRSSEKTKAAPTRLKLSSVDPRLLDVRDTIIDALGERGELRGESITEDGVRIQVQAQRDGVRISSIDTPRSLRGQGLATAAMNKIVEVADLEDVPLYLSPTPYGDSPVNAKELREWYARRFGFAGLPGREGEMVRYPIKKRLSSDLNTNSTSLEPTSPQGSLEEIGVAPLDSSLPPSDLPGVGTVPSETAAPASPVADKSDAIREKAAKKLFAAAEKRGFKEGRDQQRLSKQEIEKILKPLGTTLSEMLSAPYDGYVRLVRMKGEMSDFYALTRTPPTSELAAANAPPAPSLTPMTAAEANERVAFLLGSPVPGGKGRTRVSYKTQTEESAFRRGFMAANEKPGEPQPPLRMGLSEKDRKYDDAFRNGWSQGQQSIIEKRNDSKSWQNGGKQSNPQETPPSRPRRPGKGKKAAETATVTKEEPKVEKAAPATDIQRGDTVSVVIPRMDEPLVTEVWEVKEVNGVPHGFFDWYGMKNKPLSEMKLVRKSRQREAREGREAEAAEQRKANTVASAIAEVKREMAPTSDNRRKPADIKKELIQKIEAAIAQLEKDGATAGPTVTIKIPGDGTFTIKNNAETLANALKKAKDVKTSTTAPAPRLKTLAEYSRGLPTEEEFAAMDREKAEAERVKAENDAARKRIDEEERAPAPPPAPRRPKLQRRAHMVNPVEVAVGLTAEAAGKAGRLTEEAARRIVKEIRQSGGLIGPKGWARKMVRSGIGKFDEYATTVDARMKAIAPSALRRLQKAIGEGDRRSHYYAEGFAPFYEGVHRKIKDVRDQLGIRLSTLNGDFQETLRIAKQYGLVKEFKDAAVIIAIATQDAINSGYDINDLTIILDADGKERMIEDYRHADGYLDLAGWTQAKVNAIRAGRVKRDYWSRVVVDYTEFEKDMGRLDANANDLDGAFNKALDDKVKRWKAAQTRAYAESAGQRFRDYLRDRIQRDTTIQGKEPSPKRLKWLETSAMEEFAKDDGNAFYAFSAAKLEAINKEAARAENRDPDDVVVNPADVRLTKILREKLALTKAEKIRVVTQDLRGHGDDLVTLSADAFFGPRTVKEVTPEMLKHYRDPLETTLNTLRRIAESTAKRRFLGMDNSPGSPETTDDAIQAIVLKMHEEGKLDDWQRNQVAAMMWAVLNNSSPSNPMYGIYRGLETQANLGTALSSIAQLDDLLVGSFLYGGFGTNMGGKYLRAALAQIDSGLGTNIGGKYTASLEYRRKDTPYTVDFISEELRNSGNSALSRMMDKATTRNFWWTAFRAFDTIGKVALMNAALQDFRKMARSGNISPHFRNILQHGFLPEESAKLLEALKDNTPANEIKDGNTRALMDQLVFIEMMEMQSISSLNMTEAYLRSTSGVGRLFYLFKSFMINRISMLRKRIFAEELSPKERLSAAVHLVGIATIAKFPVELLRAAISGKLRDEEDWDRQWDYHLLMSFLGNLGLFRHNIRVAQEDGFSEGAFSVIKPAMSVPSAMRKDLERMWKDDVVFSQWLDTKPGKFNPFSWRQGETIRRLPWGFAPGPLPLTSTFMRLDYENFGEGKDYYEKRRQATRNRYDKALRTPKWDYLGNEMPHAPIGRYYGLWDERMDGFYGGNHKGEDGKLLVPPPDADYQIDKKNYRMTAYEYQTFLDRSGKRTRERLAEARMLDPAFLKTDEVKAIIKEVRREVRDEMKDRNELSLYTGKVTVPDSWIGKIGN